MGSIDPDAISSQPEPAPDQDDLQADGVSDVERQRFRYRIEYAKDGPLRYTSQLDVARIWERVFRRVGLPLIYSQGFNPRPKIQLAVGLPLGYASRCEIVDVWLRQEIADPQPTVVALNAASPQGLSITGIQPVDVRAPALQGIVRSAAYWVTFRDPVDVETLTQQVADLLAKRELWRERRDKRVDVRPLIDHLRLVLNPEVGVEMVLAASQTRGTARPDDVLQALGLELSNTLVTRTAVTFEP